MRRRLLGLILLLSVVLTLPPPAAALTVSRLPVREGMRGDDVRRIQARLKELGFYDGPVDGLFGPRTREAVGRFQEARGLPRVGFVGPRTLAALQEPPPAPMQASRERAAPATRAPARPPLPLPAPETGGRLALTFDDGPDPRVLPAILEALAEHRVRATFFVTGRQAEERPELVRLLAAGGHQVENHGYSHRPAGALGRRALREEIERTAETIRRLTGRRPRFYRPTGGDLDQDVLLAAADAGHRLILWTNIGAPDVPFPGEEKLVARLAAAAFDGAIIMLHADRPETARALPGVLSAWKARGVTPLTLSELLAGRP